MTVNVGDWCLGSQSQLDLFRTNFSPFPWLEFSQFDVPERYPHELCDWVPQRLQHATNLPILLLHEFDDEVCFAC